MRDTWIRVTQKYGDVKGYPKCGDTKIRGISKGYFKYGNTYLNNCRTGGNDSFSVQVSSRSWCEDQGSPFHSLSNVTPLSCTKSRRP